MIHFPEIEKALTAELERQGLFVTPDHFEFRWASGEGRIIIEIILRITGQVVGNLSLNECRGGPGLRLVPPLEDPPG